MNNKEITIQTGIELIAAERRRQVEQEGWAEYEDCMKHPDNELAIAAACYAVEGTGRRVVRHSSGFKWENAWPWCDEWDKRKKHNRERQLVIAGALIAAEIDRLQQLLTFPLACGNRIK